MPPEPSPLTTNNSLSQDGTFVNIAFPLLPIEALHGLNIHLPPRFAAAIDWHMYHYSRGITTILLPLAVLLVELEPMTDNYSSSNNNNSNLR